MKLFSLRTKTGRVFRMIALIVSFLWASWWIFFAIASASSESFSITTIFVVVGFIVVFGALFVIGMLFPLFGGLIQIIIGLVLLVGYPLVANNFPATTIIIMELIFGLPVFLSGIFHIITWRIEKVGKSEPC